MINNPKFIHAWPFLAVIGTFLLPMLFFTLISGDAGILSLQAFKNMLAAYPDTFSSGLGLPYFCFAVLMMIWSVIRWFKNPCKDTLLWTIFTSWVLCGYPALFIIDMSSFAGLGHG